MKHYMRDDVVAAFESFIDDVNKKVDGVSIDMNGKYQSKSNTVRPYAAGKQPGAKLTISISSGPFGQVTNYVLHPPELGDRNKSARSLRLVPDKGMPGAFVASGVPQEGMERTKADGRAGDRLERSFARAVNSMSFGCLYTDDPSAYLRPGSREDQIFQRCLSAFEDGGTDAMRADVAGAARGKRPQSAEFGMDVTDPLVRMGAWSVMSCLGWYDAGCGPENIGRPTEKGVAAAQNALGLDALRHVLEMAAQAARDGEGPGLDRLLDADTMMGRGALRGLACLTYYKAAQKADGLTWADRDGVFHFSTDESRESVFQRGAWARCEADERRERSSGLSPERDRICAIRCYQKVLGAGSLPDELRPGGSGELTKEDVLSRKINQNMQYRFYRCAVLGEDPDKASGAPKYRLAYAGDTSGKKADANQIDLVDCATGARENFLTAIGSRPEWLRRMPALERVLSVSGIPAVSALAAKQIGYDMESGMDLLELEMAAFLEDGQRGSRGDPGRTTDDLYAAFAVNSARHLKGVALYQYSYDHAVGVPDFSAGVSSFGDLYLNGVEGDISAILAAVPGRTAGNGRMAAAFRACDAEREALGAYAQPGPGAGWQAALSGTSAGSAADAYLYGLSSYAALDDSLEASMRVNDLMVLSEAYRPESQDDVLGIIADINQMYDGRQAAALYRPQNAAELKSLRDFSDGCGATRVAYGMQKSAEGLLAAVGGPKPELHGVFRQAAIDMDTFTDTSYGDVADLLEAAMPDPAPEPEPDIMKAIHAAVAETDAREADRAAGKDGRGVV